MSDLISRSALIKEFEIQEFIKNDRLFDIPQIKAFIEEQPAVEPVRGEWKFGKNHGEFVEAECTSCKGLLLVKWYDEIDKYRYCPNCGARMDGEGYEID